MFVLRIERRVGCERNKEIDTCLKSGRAHYPIGKQRFHPPYSLSVEWIHKQNNGHVLRTAPHQH